MRHRPYVVRRVVLSALMACILPAQAGAQTVEELRRELDAMKRQMGRMEQMLRKQDEVIRRLEARPPSPAPPVAAKETPDAALDRALESARTEAPPAKATAPVVPSPTLAQRPLGAGTTLRLIDVSMDTLVAGGWSTADDAELEVLQGGAHDPRRRGFTLQQAELSLTGAVDPYFTGETHIIFTDSSVELEEAFLTTQALPYGLQVEAGQMLTEFGRINPTHPHAWDWLDQPVINTRLFGGDGLRNPGVRAGWLLPLPWFAQFHVGAQNAGGETAISFLGEGGGSGGHDHGGEEEGEEEPMTIGDRPVVSRNVENLGDLLYLTRLENGFTLTDSLSASLGVSALYGPNSSGSHARTYVYGTDLIAKWRPADNFRGYPFVTWQSEVMGRNFGADAVDDEHVGELPSTTLYDWGLYSQLLYGFRYGWAAGLRYEYAAGSGASVGGREADPFRDDRHRISPLLSWRPTEFSRLRLQYNLDRAGHLHDDWESTVWLGVEILYGQHPAHNY
jgi:hypothetical protein